MTYRVAIVGAGIGAKHMDGYLLLPDRFQVSLVCDLNEALAGAQADRAGAAVTTSIAEVLADPDVQIVDICLPPAMHVPVACDALAAGKHVIVEKPMAGSVVEGDRLVAAAEASKHQVFPVFQYRYGRALRQLAALEAAELLGAPRVASLETHWNRKADYYTVSWRGTWAHEMGGAVLSHAIHIHDLIALAFGPVTEVSAMLATAINPIETEDCAALCFRTEKGGLVTSSVTLGAATDTSRLRMVFERATVNSGHSPYAPGEDVWTFTAREAADQEKIDRVIVSVGDEPQGFAGYLKAVADALEGRAHGAVTIENGQNSIELVTAIYHADRTGGRVRLPLARDLPICRGWGPT